MKDLVISKKYILLIAQNENFGCFKSPGLKNRVEGHIGNITLDAIYSIAGAFKLAKTSHFEL